MIGALAMAAAVVMLAIHPRLGYPDADELPGAPGDAQDGRTPPETPAAPGL